MKCNVLFLVPIGFNEHFVPLVNGDFEDVVPLGRVCNVAQTVGEFDFDDQRTQVDRARETGVRLGDHMAGLPVLLGVLPDVQVAVVHDAVGSLPSTTLNHM